MSVGLASNLPMVKDLLLFLKERISVSQVRLPTALQTFPLTGMSHLAVVRRGTLGIPAVILI